MAVFHKFYQLASGDFANRALIILLPKKDGAVQMNDFRPISLSLDGKTNCKGPLN